MLHPMAMAHQWLLCQVSHFARLQTYESAATSQGVQLKPKC